jgi:GNAT superfamily N-acetyltransferase
MDMHEALDQFFALSEDGQTHFVKFLQGQITSQNACVLVAQVGGDLVGYSLAASYEYPPVLTTRQYAEIHDLFVADDHRGKGIGRRLIEETVDHFFQKGITRVEIRQAVSNAIADAFWAKMGFVPYLKVRVLERPRC